MLCGMTSRGVGGWGGRKRLQRKGIYKHIADSCCTAGTTTTLQQLTPPKLLLSIWSSEHAMDLDLSPGVRAQIQNLKIFFSRGPPIEPGRQQPKVHRVCLGKKDTSQGRCFHVLSCPSLIAAQGRGGKPVYLCN